mgnify:CR=1 FL=1
MDDLLVRRTEGRERAGEANLRANDEIVGTEAQAPGFGTGRGRTSSGRDGIENRMLEPARLPVRLKDMKVRGRKRDGAIDPGLPFLARAIAPKDDAARADALKRVPEWLKR